MQKDITELGVSGIVDLSSAFYGSSILFAALDLDLFTLINQQEDASLSLLADLLQVPERGLCLLLDGAVAVGLLHKKQNVYQLTQATRMTLVKGAPHDLTQAIVYNRDVYHAWGRLTELVKTAQPVESPALHLGEDFERTRRFAYSMHGRAMGIGRIVVPLLELKPHARILDLAGGPGTYALLMANTSSDIDVDTYDLPAISKVAEEITAAYASQVTCHAGDYHVDTYPENSYDCVTIFGALHQESPEAIVSILMRAYAALKKGGKIFILDLMTGEDHTTPPFSALFAVNMALTTDNGWVFSDKEIVGWLKEAGFHSIMVDPIPPPMPHWLVVAHK